MDSKYIGKRHLWDDSEDIGKQLQWDGKYFVFFL